MSTSTYLGHPHDLQLSDVKRDADGLIVSGWVDNGNWFLTIENGIGRAWYSRNTTGKPVTDNLDFSNYTERATQ